MWIPVLLMFDIWGHVLSQKNNANNAGGTPAQWGWQMRQTGPGTIGQYFVKLPQSEQRVRYVADGSGYHGAVAVSTSDQDHVHTTNFALGDRALKLSNTQLPAEIYGQTSESSISTQKLASRHREQGSNPLEIFLLREQYPAQNQLFEILPNNPIQLAPLSNIYYSNNVTPTPSYYRLNDKHAPKNEQNLNKISNNQKQAIQKSTYNNEEIIETKENGPVVRVFKDHKCLTEDLNDNDNHQNHYLGHLKKSTFVDADESHLNAYNVHGNFGARHLNNYQEPRNYQTADSLRKTNERYYYSTEISHSTTTRPVSYAENEGISKLVASTQDLISNEDLLRINHAAERVVNGYSDDIIKSKRKSVPRTINFDSNRAVDPRSRITVTAKIGNVLDSHVEHPQNERREQSTNNEHRFVSPIIVADPNYSTYKEQIVNNLVSTMVPYIQEGYEIIGLQNILKENRTYSNEENKSVENLVNITPRPISPNYLAPITVALRLLNANHSDILNTIEDHEGSESEFIEKTAEHPEKGRTIVEIQESIPVEITHINDVEYHEYLDEGRSNNENPFGAVKTLYQKYLQSLDEAQNAQNQYDSKSKNSEDDDEKSNEEEAKENLQSSENVRSEVQVQANFAKGINSYSNYYNTEDKQRLIQPIVIEKQVPVTKFVNRFIEKKIPYPEPVEVVKSVPVDRPVPIPVHYETIVEKPVEVTRYVDKPYPVNVPYPVEVRVPFPVERNVYIDRPVHVPYPVEKVIEKQFIQQVAVPTPVGIPIGIHFPVERKVLYPVPLENRVPVPVPVEKQVPYPVRHEIQIPVPYPVEKRIPVPIEKNIEKPVTVTRVIEKPIHIKVPVPVAVHVPKPYPVERIIEKKVPYPVTVQKIVEKKVPVQVPYPVKTFVERIVEKPVVVTKYIDKPYAVEKRIPYPVEKIVERKVPYPVHVPVEVKVPYPVEKNNQNPDNPYPFEKVEKQTLYTYGIQQNTLLNVADYLKYNQEQYQQALPNYIQSNVDYNTQQQAESQRNYQIQLANAQILRNLQNVTPVYTTQGDSQYASSYNYVNASVDNKHPPIFNSLNQGAEMKYQGPPPMKNYDDQWTNNTDYTERLRRTDRTPKVSNLRIEYGGFKPPLRPSTEIDLDGVPINKNTGDT